jgi:cyclohexanone monooxygenase
MKHTAIHLDALVVGAGFGGIYQLYALRKLGLNVKVIDLAGDVGGTWYWNRYPGAMSDTESFVYRYSWDKEDLSTYPWSHHYVKQPEVLKYLEHVVDRHDLRKHMQFNIELLSADWDASENLWRVETSIGQTFKVRYLITALGLLSKANYPEIKGLDTFKGELTHTAAWRSNLSVDGKNVGVIGCGSTGVQVITEVAKKVKSLTCFQRTPQYSVPSGDRPVSPEYRQFVNSNYDDINAQVRNSICGFGFVESTVTFDSVSPEKREQIFEELWNQGNGFRFLFGGFSDIATNREANEAACQFIRNKISETVKDPEKAKKLTPHDLYARRPLCDGGYYEQFNRENVSIVDLKETPITTITPEGVQTEDGTVHKLDMLIFATGFDAVEGNYLRLKIRGREGKTLKDHWANGPTSYLGVFVPYFPNLFTITGPQGPFTNLPPAIEAHVELIAASIERAEAARKMGGRGIIEALPEAEEAWVQECEKVAEGSLFKETTSWIFGNNISGKKVALRFYFGGLAKYYQTLKEVAEDEYRGFKPLSVGSADAPTGVAGKGGVVARTVNVAVDA